MMTQTIKKHFQLDKCRVLLSSKEALPLRALRERGFDDPDAVHVRNTNIRKIKLGKVEQDQHNEQENYKEDNGVCDDFYDDCPK